MGETTVEKKTAAEKDRQAKLDFAKSACPAKPVEKWRSQETQDAIDILDVRLTHIVDTLSRQPTGWTKVLSAAFATLTTKGGNENTLNYATQDLIDEGEASVVRLPITRSS